MNEELKKVIVGLLKYSMEGVEWQFSSLTQSEKEIVGNQETLNRLIEFCS